MRFSLVETAWLACFALPLVILDTPLLPNVHFRSWRLVRILFSTGPNHLSQGVGHSAEGCVTLGWNLASVVNDPLGAPRSTQLYLCLPSVCGALLNIHYSWGHYGNKAENPGPQDLKKKRDSPSTTSQREILQQGTESSGAPLRGPAPTSELTVEISAKGRDESVVR
jgi:hypothetical protein